LLIFTVPVAYLVGAAFVPVNSYFYDGLNTQLFSVPLGQSVCTFWLGPFGIGGLGRMIVCPLGVVQVFLAGTVQVALVESTILGMFLFLIPIVVVGNVFCGWVCPVGTIIDSFDKAVEVTLPKLNAKREERAWKNKRKRATQKSKFSVTCPSCPFGKLASRFGIVGQGVLVSSFVGSAIFKVPVFCVVCPIGIATRGAIHLATLMSITGRVLPVIVELWAIPVVAVVASLREKKYWCKKVCPMGAMFSVAGSLNPFLKPVVKSDKCVMKGCPEDCQDYHSDYCLMCRQIDHTGCERVCSLDINLTDKESLSRCTKCMECYISCDRDAVEIKFYGTPDAIPKIVSFFKRKQKTKLKKTV
jgi:ferredoxin-type protein NapH